MAPVNSPGRGGDTQQNCKPGSDGDDFCAICDDGGDVTCCDGICGRSFHLADACDEDSKCRLALHLTKEQAKMIIDCEENFICKNCKYNEHQCFACGLLGSSVEPSAEVFQCRNDDCAHFYHPKCVAELLYNEPVERSFFEVEVAAGEKFTCPVHECSVCKGAENKDDRQMQFALCRRCPTAYHRKCLPSDIPFKTKKGPNGYMQRAWDKWDDGTARDRILIYCTKHEIIKKLGTPRRNHIILPDVKKLRVPKMVVAPPMEEEIPEEEEPIDTTSPEEEELIDTTSPEPPQSPTLAASDQNQCSCSSPIHSFAPKSLFMHPHPGSGGWLGD